MTRILSLLSKHFIMKKIKKDKLLLKIMAKEFCRGCWKRMKMVSKRFSRKISPVKPMRKTPVTVVISLIKLAAGNAAGRYQHKIMNKAVPGLLSIYLVGKEKI